MTFSNLENWEQQCGRVVVVAMEIIAEKVGVIEGAMKLLELRSSVTSDQFDPDFSIFVVVNSQTDHLPIGAVRQFWADDALAQKDKEIRSVEEYYRDSVFDSCRRLIERFDQSV